jgi:PAS domain S-box-containing protein
MQTREWLAPSLVTAAACLAGGALAHAAVRADIYATGLPAGIGLAALLIWGLRVLPAIVVASAIGMALSTSVHSAFLHGDLPDWPVFLGVLLAARLLLGWWLLARVFEIDVNLSRVRDVAALVLVTVVVLPLFGVLVHASAGLAAHGWPLGVVALLGKRAFDEAVGLLLVVPAVLSWTRPRPVEATSRCRMETGILLFVTALASVIVYGALRDPWLHMESLRYALFPLVFWAALRLALRETAALLLLSGSIALALSGLASAGMAPMGLPDPHLFLLALSITGLVGAAAQQQRVLAELRLRESEQRYRMLIENMNEGVIMTDRDARVTFVSDRFCEMIGYSREEMLGRTGEDVTVPEDREAWREAQARRRQGIQQPHALTMRRKDGEHLNMWISPRPLFDADGVYEGSLNIVLDMTAQRRAEEQSRQHLQQLAHVSRLSSMGEMASAIAHEINQPLTAIANYASASLRLLRAGKITPQETTATMERLAAEAARAGEVVRKMRGFVKGEEGHLAAVEVGFLISEVLRLAQPEARQHGVELTIAPLPELPPVFADSIQIQQVLLNLVRNAVEAIASGECERRSVTVSARALDGGRVQIEVADSGPGIAPDELERVFDAFFTTKPDGIGIGLALSRSIAEAHGGTLAATSSAQGAVFRLTLPAARETEIANA